MTTPTYPLPPVPMPPGVVAGEDGIKGIVWNILGQTYTPKSCSESSMSWHAVFPPGTFVPHHIHFTQDEFVYILSGELEAEVGGKLRRAGPGDLVVLPRGIAHGLFNRSGADVVAMFWVSPTAKLWEMFSLIHNVPDPAEVVRIAGFHELEFVPPPALD
ncbi:cupin domain-containing protein [Pseudomonas sp. GX19020]|uniref:cupin domain-containing protein n=1 Tax=Pseudomonadota TaxID=1224 RepID=UPI00089BD650|nr:MULTISPECIES: cupin domain-containing protein [Pseudomonadota]MCL4067474.1 cupin domain-containing protein [Pseudomonas sp. GX19020]SED82596.1 Cupin domain-containing protein [Rhodobacter sp. 24-YEA-8]